MEILAAVMTGSGTSAIATLEVLGPEADSILSQIFTPCGPKPLACQVGSIRIGTLHDKHRPIDQITLGCEGGHHWALHCHGNPLITEAAMALLKAHGVTLTSAQNLRAQKLSNENMSACQQEAHLALAHCKTLLGARLLDHQAQSGLAGWALAWQDNTPGCTLDLHSECRVILAQSHIAHQILSGVDVALIGPPNSGKSTLINSLSGQDAAIVTDIKGTTRDWVEADCRTERLALHLIDTAGLDTAIQREHLDTESQHRTLDVINRVKIILLILDCTHPADQIESHWIENLPNIPRLTVLNKSDQPSRLNLKDLNLDPTCVLSISAKEQTGLTQLLDEIERTLSIKNFDITQPLCTTPRQQEWVGQILAAQTMAQAQGSLKCLLDGE
jgi:tRNA modification GTPase